MTDAGDDRTRYVGVLGPRSLIASALLPRLQQLHRVVAISRGSEPNETSDLPAAGVPLWISLMPISALPARFALLEACGARRIVAVSSTSIFTKTSSSDAGERRLIAEIAEGEERLAAWAQSRGIEWIILRPTLIYGRGRDHNICEIVRFIRRFRCFPLLGPACGLRQPVHCDDVAAACASALASAHVSNRSYNVSGAEIIPYREMIIRIFAALGQRPRLVTTPLWLFTVAVAGLRAVPRLRHWSPAMAERMNQDMVFDHVAARQDLGFDPRGFALAAADIPD